MFLKGERNGLRGFGGIRCPFKPQILSSTYIEKKKIIKFFALNMTIYKYFFKLKKKCIIFNLFDVVLFPLLFVLFLKTSKQRRGISICSPYVIAHCIHSPSLSSLLSFPLVASTLVSHHTSKHTLRVSKGDVIYAPIKFMNITP